MYCSSETRKDNQIKKAENDVDRENAGLYRYTHSFLTKSSVIILHFTSKFAIS